MGKKKNQVICENNTFKIGEIVLAKIRGYAAWPAKVIFSVLRFLEFCVAFSICFSRQITQMSNIKIEVVFFGDRTTGSISPSNVSKFINDSSIINKNMKKKGYEKAVKEALMEMAKSKRTNGHRSPIENASADISSKKCVHIPIRRSPRFAKESLFGVATIAVPRRSRRVAERLAQKRTV